MEVGNYWSGIGFEEVDVVEVGNFRTLMSLTSQPITVGFSQSPSPAAYNSGVQPLPLQPITVGTFLGDISVRKFPTSTTSTSSNRLPAQVVEVGLSFFWFSLI